MLKIFSFIFCALSTSAFASFPDYFGTAVSTASIGNQASANHQDAANVYYHPSMAGFAKKVSFAGSISTAQTSFPEINGVIKKNTATSSTTESGSVRTDYPNYQSYTLNFILPLRYENAGSLGFFLSAPIGTMVEQSSGHPEWPEYVMYRARYRRTQVHLNYAQPIGDQFSISIGAFLGFQASAKVETQVSLGNNFGSQATASSKVKPSVGAVIGASYRYDDQMLNFTYQQEMKTNLESEAFGEIVDPSISLINISINSLMFYDPHTFRIQWSKKTDAIELMTGVDYQMWSNYRPPTIQVINQGGSVKGSNDFEKLNLRNTFTPKLGTRFFLNDSLSFSGGLSYRQSPIEGDFSGSGNSIDLDTWIYALGSEYRFDFLDHVIKLGASFQYQKLEDRKVTKSSGLENGGTGQKIGAPGYNVGGDVKVAMLGLSILF
ncbi:MAG: hypothetical protein COW00_12785 [Bdellovibrio sp. CG12_big_fil_rev_8_21_14_0_65_39_13]|nr:MAG: hypothetical protein COW78_05105 [Bdellovibrio sp. CG22_combo_CG10-13_8_21_14_all_39_27]PIQ58957.1 MAG: hypothetical protein COW00_12785 [Bdellovibrio sp. CG12_big_fil_rev_8_21_14_0_65_39_13]PIR33925.1 MAG: hypothetical protein COV37_14500 [Bdellovibrio sp. CG11_big_fil_rev_8_21_14_0_20_39_38]PJB52268.1 MAG: hypothetical protein CO099_13485 [Bdellovibrio sp. CG_4_9_14_3_um_filter_39_7]